MDSNPGTTYPTSKQLLEKVGFHNFLQKNAECLHFETPYNKSESRDSPKVDS